MSSIKNVPDGDHTKINTILKLALAGAFLVAAVLLSILTFIAVRDFVTSQTMVDMPGVSINGATSTPNAEGVITDLGAPLQPSGGPTPEPWDGASRISLLVMGLDYRDWAAGEGPPRTDTMILFTLDPLSGTAGMINIPRDLWVAIPGYEYGKINTAYQIGEAFKLPGGGPELSIKAVESLLGVPIDYYAQIDFGAFIRFIDEIGGVKLDIQDTIKIDLLGDNTFKKLKPGRQTLNGEIALAYARSRSTEGGDFDRAQRQQEVVMGIRNQMLRVEMLPMLISKSPVLYQELSSGVRTNLSLDQVIRLAWFAKDIPEDKIHHAIIGPEQVNFFKTPDGLDALKPLPDQIRLLRDELFTTNVSSPVANTMSSVDLMKTEAARVRVLNGSATSGQAALMTEYLKTQGFNIVETGNADQIYNTTAVFDYTGKPYTIKYLIELLSVNANSIYNRYDPASQVDLTVIVGVDWVPSVITP